MFTVEAWLPTDRVVFVVGLANAQLECDFHEPALLGVKSRLCRGGTASQAEVVQSRMDKRKSTARAAACQLHQHMQQKK